MSTDDPGTPGRRRPPRPWERGNPGADGPPRPPHPPTAGGDGGPQGAPMPAVVSGLRVLMMVIGGIQAVIGLALVTNSVSIATSVWGETDASVCCRSSPGEEHAGTVVFVGLLIMAVAAWGIVTALKFPTRHPDLRNSAMAYGWVAILFTVLLWAFLAVPVLVAVWLVLSILLTARSHQPECRAWFDGRRR
ncbi:hypothetical protein ABZ695_33305 [Streptomyces sp. NPDC006976]|uniref:hypothetical protein n=1 Tax=Streptomyces sp. NPDC006976 TaxID=3154311 RepID=UPI0033E6F932